MAGSITNNAALYRKKTFTYVPPAPPADLIDCSNFILDFTGRKFLNVGLDPTDEFNTVVQIITPSRYINMPTDFLRRIFSLMGNILSFILDLHQKYKRNIFLETEIISLSSMVYQGENMLVIESKAQAGCRVLLNRADLIKLQYLEWSITETVVRKSTLIRSVALSQFQIISDYIDREFTNVKSPPKNIDEMVIFIKNLRDDSVISNMSKNDVNLISQLKIYASSQLAEQWAQRWNGEMSSDLFTDSEMRLISPLSPPRYSSMSPMHDDDDNDFDPSQAQAADVDRGINDFLRQINPTQATCAPTKSSPVSSSLPTSFIDTLPDYDSDNFAQDPYGRIKSFRKIEPSPTSPAVDENDGPTSFNLSPSILGFTDQKLIKKLNKRNVKRKLFE